MAELSVKEQQAAQRLAWNRRQATVAVQLLQVCLGVPVKLAMNVSDPIGRDFGRLPGGVYGEGLYKDTDTFNDNGGVRCQVTVVDEQGAPKARTAEFYTVAEMLELLAKLPLALSPQAQRWLRHCLGEARMPRPAPVAEENRRN